MAEDSWFLAELPINGQFYPVKARIYTNKKADSIEFSAEMQYRSIDTSFSMHTTGVYNTASETPVWQNSVRSGLYWVEWSFRDYKEKPAATYWRSPQSNGTTTFDNDVLPEEFLYFLAEKIDTVVKSKVLKLLSPVWEESLAPDVWIVDAEYTGKKTRIHGVDCYQVLYTRMADGAKAEYYITEKGKQVWRFQTFKGVWFDRMR
ncbi:MAG: hypothetical protein FWC26_06895 [Fibromonadales bacterium]|nr:hypothetical protein [Fibromonadales bacterium]